MNPYRYALSFRVRHPTLKAIEIQDSLSLIPEVSHSVGERRRTPTGAALDGLYKETYCTFKKSKGPDSQLDSELERCNAALSKHKSFLSKIKDSGGRLEYFVGLFLDGNSGFSVTSDEMRQMQELGIDLSLDIYP